MFEKLPSYLHEFKGAMLTECIAALKLRMLTDNFDKERFNFDGVDRSNVFDVSERAYWLSWFFDKTQDLYLAYKILDDERSRRLFLNILAYRIAGHHSVRIDTSFDETGEAFRRFLDIQGGVPSALPAKGMFGTLMHYDFEYEGKRYKIDCLGLKYYLFRRQYFLDRDGVRIMPMPGDVVVDAGACLGDTAIVFGRAVGERGRVFAFDPVEDHLEVLRFNIAQNPESNIVALPFGLADKEVEGRPIRVGSYSPGFKSGEQSVPLRTLDSLVASGEIDRIDFIKMDIEGAELAALQGAREAIRRFKPKLAISLYHRPDDIHEIPMFIKQSFPFYETYIDHYTIHGEETVLYCRPRAPN